MVYVCQFLLIQTIKEVERKCGDLSKVGSRQRLDILVPHKYHPEMYTTHFLRDDDTQLYQSYIRILRWDVELGRIDLCLVVGRLACFSAVPRRDHLHATLIVFSYSKILTNLK